MKENYLIIFAQLMFFRMSHTKNIGDPNVPIMNMHILLLCHIYIHHPWDHSFRLYRKYIYIKRKNQVRPGTWK